MKKYKTALYDIGKILFDYAYFGPYLLSKRHFLSFLLKKYVFQYIRLL